MKFKYSLPCLLLLVVMLTGCGHNFDSSGYVTSIMDTLYKGTIHPIWILPASPARMFLFTVINGLHPLRKLLWQLLAPARHPKKPQTGSSLC